MEADRHVAFDERCGGIGAGHTGADVERLIAPQRRVHQAAVFTGQALAIAAMAHRTLFGIHLLAVVQVRLDRGIDLADPAPGHFVARLGVHFHPVEIGHHRLHVR
ncbi:hypothetical protein D3C85_1542080 [compost metagenome]